MLQEEMQFRMTAGVDRDFKERHEDVLQHLLEISQLLLCMVHITVEMVIVIIRYKELYIAYKIGTLFVKKNLFIPYI